MFDDITGLYKVTLTGARSAVAMELTRAEAAGEVCVICGYLFPNAQTRPEALDIEPYGTYRKHGETFVVVACAVHTDSQRLF